MSKLLKLLLFSVFLLNIPISNAEFGTVYNPSSSSVMSGRDNSLRGAKQNPLMPKNNFNYNRNNTNNTQSPFANSTSSKSNYYSTCQYGICTPGGNSNSR